MHVCLSYISGLHKGKYYVHRDSDFDSCKNVVRACTAANPLLLLFITFQNLLTRTCSIIMTSITIISPLSQFFIAGCFYTTHTLWQCIRCDNCIHFSFLQGAAIFFFYVIRSKRVSNVYNMTCTHNSCIV